MISKALGLTDCQHRGTEEGEERGGGEGRGEEGEERKVRKKLPKENFK